MATATAANGDGTGMKAATTGQVCHKREVGGGRVILERREQQQGGGGEVECKVSYEFLTIRDGMCSTREELHEKWGVLLRKPKGTLTNTLDIHMEHEP